MLRPIRSVIFVDAVGSRELAPSDHLSEAVGQKAYGLACLPTAWTLPFIVVDISGPLPSDDQLLDAALAVSLNPHGEVIVRSSCRTETIEMRGQMGDSIHCQWADVRASLIRLRDGLPPDEAPYVGIVQAFARVNAKGHLSNERRVAKADRDWLFEQESAQGAIADKQRIAIRTWRNNADMSALPLSTRSMHAVPQLLRRVALWATLQKVRVHFEWVWNGRDIYVVQADDASLASEGESPKDLVASFLPAEVDTTKMHLWRIADTHEYATYRKLQNAALYKRLAYQLPAFYVFDHQELLRQISCDTPSLSEEFLEDLVLLTRRPLVIRTDGVGLPDDMRQMLPRSDELRSAEEAKNWIINKLGPKLQYVWSQAALKGGHGFKLVLIAHHFLPANASAWARAVPGTPRVRIEALWGIPEGLYWYSHDVYDVDTRLAVAVGADLPKSMKIHEKQRYKSKFVAPNPDGQWIVHRTDMKHDWAKVLRADEAKEIAWTTRRIAEELQEPVVVMWFVNPAPGSVRHRVLPWYHERAATTMSPRVVSAQHSFGDVALVETKRDWDALKARPAGHHQRVRIEPKEPELVRDKAFADDVATFAKSNGMTIELAGGVLSHVYYVLTNHGCNVECIDLDDFVDDTPPTEFNKLVRDNIPAAIVQGGETVSIVALKGDALLSQLRMKVVEEAFEVADARTAAQIAEELADLEEVTDALRNALGISKRRVADARKRKLRNRGGFEQGIMLRTASAPSPLKTAQSRNIFVDTPAQKSDDVKVESDPNALPSTSLLLHVDRRTNATGEEARQLTAVFGVGLTTEIRASSTFGVATASGHEFPLLADLSVDRVGGRIRVRVVLRRAPDQLVLDLEPAGSDSK